MKKKILIISAVFPPEPIVSANISFSIASEVSKKNRVVVIVPKPTRPLGFIFNREAIKFDFEYVQLKSYTCPRSSLFGRIRESYSFGRHCKRYIEMNKSEIELIYANTWPLISQYIIVKAAKRNNIPVIIHVQDIYPESFINKLPFGKMIINSILLPLDRFTLRNADKTIAISQKMKDYLVRSRGIVVENVVVVQNWRNEQEFPQNDSNTLEESRPFTFMYLGNIGPVANIELLIEAFKNSEIANCRLVIAGSGSMREKLERKVTENSYPGIEFWDVPYGKVQEIQAKADVMLLPIRKGSAISSIPSKLSAYLFSGKPVIASVDEGSDTADTIMTAKCGWVIEPQNSDKLSDMMKKVATFQQLELEKLGRNGFDYANENLKAENNLSKITSIIKEFITND